MSNEPKTIKLTFALVHEAGSYGGRGFNRKQLDLLNVNWPPKQGWVKWLNGQEIPLSTWQQVMALKGRAKWVVKRERNQALKSKQ